MIGTNTTALAQNSFQGGRKEGINDVMGLLNDLVHDKGLFTEEELKVLKRAYKILDEEFPCED